jgi:hypothetical protein
MSDVYAACAGPAASYIKQRGILILDSDIKSLGSWPKIAKDAGLTTLGIGPGSIGSYLTNFLNTSDGKRFLAHCNDLGIGVEHELHTIQELLPRSLFNSNPGMFRMNSSGQRTPDYNCCAHSISGIQVICNNAVSYARQLVSTTGRYYFWFDDLADSTAKCYCPQCSGLYPSEQALIVSNAIIAAIRANIDPNAQLAHLCYQSYLDAPRSAYVTPAAGMFLEFAPLSRVYDHPLSNRSAGYSPKKHGQLLDYLDANLAVFGNSTAKVLEYWLDVSMYSSWQLPYVEVPWRNEIFQDDLHTYTSRGITNITSYGAWLNAYYLIKFGSLPVKEYAQGLISTRP